MRPVSRFLAAAVLAVAAALPATVPAGTATANLGVSATVGSGCVVLTTPVAFGTYNAGSATPTDSAGSIVVTCTTGTTYSVALDAGASASTASNVTTRRMTAGTARFLPYQLYLDNAYATVWGDGANGSSVSPASGSHTATGLPQSLNVYGRIAVGQFVTAGIYADTVVATVTYN